jgi:hypothetical protein
MFESSEPVVDATVLVESATAVPQQADVGFTAVVDFLKALAARDIAAPAFGSASKLKEFQKEDGYLRVQAVDGAALVRVYHQQASELNEEVSAGKYVKPNGERTDEPWTETILFPGMELETPVIESNAVTIAIYN